VETIPDLARADSTLAQRGAALALERSRRIPDVTVMAGGRHYAEGSDAALVVGFSVPIPLFDQNQGNILAATHAETKARLEREAATITVEMHARQAHAALQAAFEQVTALRERAIPQATRAYEGARDAYTRGLFRYLEVLDAQRTLFELRSEHLAALDAYYRAAADVARWVGDASETATGNDATGGLR
jgi:cobalt-zinc-cadmium efflux system outer membrane protein